jgi:hypothetical protein
MDARVEGLLGNNVMDYTMTTDTGFYELSLPEGYAYTVRVAAGGYAPIRVQTDTLTGDVTDFNMAFGAEDVDDVAPVITETAPAEGSFLTGTVSEVSAVLTDDHAGIDPASIVFTMNGSNVVFSYDPGSGRVSHFPAANLPGGDYTVSVSVEDYAGNPATETWSFTFYIPIEVGPGDVNGDGGVDLGDAILALQVVATFHPAGVQMGAEVNGDGVIGLAEAIHILQRIAADGQ